MNGDDEKMKEKIIISPEMEKIINDILNRENDVLIKYHKNKGEIVILEQILSVKDKFKITIE